MRLLQVDGLRGAALERASNKRRSAARGKLAVGVEDDDGVGLGAGKPVPAEGERIALPVSCPIVSLDDLGAETPRDRRRLVVAVVRHNESAGPRGKHAVELGQRSTDDNRFVVSSAEK